MESQRNDKSFVLTGLVLLIGMFLFGLFMGAKVCNTEERLVKLTLNAKIGNAKEVRIAGSFNDWKTRCCLVKSSEGDEWSIQLQLKPGVYEYVLIVDGKQWVPAKDRGRLQDGFGGRNGILIVSNQKRSKQGGGNV